MWYYVYLIPEYKFFVMIEFANRENREEITNISISPATDFPPPSEPIELTEHSHIVTQEFVSQFTTLFLYHHEATTYLGNLLNANLHIRHDAGMYIRQNFGTYEGSHLINRELLPPALLSEPSFCYNLTHSAIDFTLHEMYEFDFPLISMHFAVMFANGQTPRRIYKYNDGFSYAGSILFYRHTEFFRDTEGRLLALTGDMWQYPILSYVFFENGQVRLETADEPRWNGLYLYGDWVTPIPILRDLENIIRHNSRPIALARVLQND
jgi:hypothetical protein